MLRDWMIVLAVFSSLAECNAQERKSPPSTTGQELTPAQVELNLESFDYVWETVRDKYFDPLLAGLDWEQIGLETRPRVADAKSMDEVREILGEMVSRLGVSHFAIVPQQAYEELDLADRPRGGEIGFDVRLVDGRVLVTSVREGSPAAQAGVVPGWELVRVEDAEVAPRIAALREELQDHPHRRTILTGAAKSRLRGPIGDRLPLEFRDGNDAAVSLEIAFVEPRGRKAAFGNIPEFHVWIDTHPIEDDIGYIAFNAFMDPIYVMTEFNQAMNDWKEFDGIILDVRGNGGGMGEMAMGMVGWLIDESQLHLGTLIFRDTQLKMLVNPRPRPFSGPVVVLIDEMSVSAAEFFASGIKDIGRGHLIGTRTAGAALGSSVEKLPNGDGFQYAAVNYISSKTGEPIEGVGVEPHIVVAPTREALLQGRDLALERAIQWIRDHQE